MSPPIFKPLNLHHNPQTTVSVRVSAAGGEMIELPNTRQTSAETVWHYTSAAGLIGILQSGTLWASSTLTLNDPSELIFGRDVVIEVWQRMKESLGIENKYLDEVIQNLTTSAMSRQLYIICASKNSDSLNQWQAYAGRQGYAIELRTTYGYAYVANGDPDPGSLSTYFRSGWYDVLYDLPDQQEAARQTLLHIHHHATPSTDVGHDRFGGIGWSQAMGLLIGVVARLKHAAFKVEQEVRFIFNTFPTSRERFRAGPLGLVPYVALACAPQLEQYVSSPQWALPIFTIKAGPSDEAEAAGILEGMRRLAVNEGYTWVRCTKSTVPYRFG